MNSIEEQVKAYNIKAKLLGKIQCTFKIEEDNVILSDIKDWSSEKSLIVPNFVTEISSDIFDNKEFNNIIIGKSVNSPISFKYIKANNITIDNNNYIPEILMLNVTVNNLIIDANFGEFSVIRNLRVLNTFKLKGSTDVCLSYYQIQAKVLDLFEYEYEKNMTVSSTNIKTIILPYKQKSLYLSNFFWLTDLEKLILSENIKTIHGSPKSLSCLAERFNTSKVTKEVISYEIYHKEYNISNKLDNKI